MVHKLAEMSFTVEGPFCAKRFDILVNGLGTSYVRRIRRKKERAKANELLQTFSVHGDRNPCQESCYYMLHEFERAINEA